MISVFLTKEDSELFIAFQQHHDTFKTLHDTGVFEVRNGSATLNFNSNGTLTDINCNIKVYKKGFPPCVSLHALG